MESLLHNLNSLDIGLISTIATLLFYLLRLRIAPLTDIEKSVVSKLLFALLIGIANTLYKWHSEHNGQMKSLVLDAKAMQEKIVSKRIVKEVG